MMLLRTVSLARGESPFSHLIRLTAANRESTPARLLRHFQAYPRSTLLAGLIDMAAFSKANGSEMEDVCGSFDAFRRKGMQGGSISGVPVLSGGMRPLSDASFCLPCARADGYIEAVWHLSNYSCCPKHRLVQRISCDQCGSGASWNRPGLFDCKCGGSLIGREIRRPGGAEVAVCGIMRCAFFPEAEPCGRVAMPIDQLRRLSLEDFQLVIRFFASHTVDVRRTSTGKVSQGVLANTARGAAAFDNWPFGFRAALDSIERVRGKPLHASAGRHKWIVQILGRSRLEKPEFKFISSEINARIRQPERERMNVVEGVAYFGIGEAARRLSVDPRTLLKACCDGAVSCIPTKRNGREGFVVETKSIPLAMRKSGKPMEFRMAARSIGLPQSLLRRAEESKLFEKTVRAFSFRGGGWAMEDVKRIRRKLDDASLASPSLPSLKGREVVSLSHVLRQSFLSVGYRYSLLTSFLGGDLAVIRKGAGFRGVCVDGAIRSTRAQLAWEKSGISGPASHVGNTASC